MRTRLILPAVITVAGLTLGACSSSNDHEGMNNGASMDGMGSMGTDNAQRSMTTLDIPDDAEFNAPDVAFAQGMIPHHGQAVQMADMALEISTNPD